jgi:hypothetical protein
VHVDAVVYRLIRISPLSLLSVEQKFLSFRLVVQSLVGVSKGGNLRDAIQYTGTSLYGPVVSDAGCVNLCNYELRNGLCIIQGGSYVMHDGRLIHCWTASGPAVPHALRNCHPVLVY